MTLSHDNAIVNSFSSLSLLSKLGGLVPITAVKHHFDVSNSYVINKLRLLVFPWRHKPWSRRARRTENGQSEFLPPRDDVNSPDLYIPREFTQLIVIPRLTFFT